jgi:hypothetical protein
VRGFDAPSRLIPTPDNAVHSRETGGPKMRKWYGQESNSVPRDGGEQAEQVRHMHISAGGVTFLLPHTWSVVEWLVVWCGVEGVA